MKKEKHKKLKYWIGKAHLWLGLSSGLLIFVIAITGCLYAFQAEITDAIEPHRFVEAQNRPVLLPSVMKKIGEEALPGKHMHAILYPTPGRAAQVIYYNDDPLYYYVVYLNPYTGKVIKVSDENATFFRFILDGHFYLWLPPEIGQPIVASISLVFLVMLISGIVLWWPKNKVASNQRFSIKWSARWRRKNYDLHNVLGFYSSAIALILALTGLVWGFQWFANGLHTVAGGEKSLLFTEPVSDSTKAYDREQPAIDVLYQRMRTENPTAKIIEVHIPVTRSSAIEVAINPDDETYWQTDYRYFDQNTLAELSVDHIYGKLADNSAGDNLIRMNYDIHTGAVIGLPGKILAFCASLLVASLPVTGFYIWYGRRKKEKAESLRKVKSKSVKQPMPVAVQQ
ncbi:MAG TPA: PepSY-associated TM helix domain-containing protein [Chryseolinea sp.]|nr:PepSY-associated TM helix domain-containing protein [Chryseolinea sp.]